MTDQPPPIRMVFELAREEHPRLYDDLIRFPKGTKRINRLRTLAHDGVLVQLGAISQVAPRETAGQHEDGTTHSLTNQIFESPLKE